MNMFSEFPPGDVFNEVGLTQVQVIDLMKCIYNPATDGDDAQRVLKRAEAFAVAV
jgi:hypothetical protein